MGSEMIGVLGLGLLLVLMVLRVPVALTMLIVGVGGFAQVISWSAALSMVRSVPVEVLTNYSFSAVPMFILMGCWRRIRAWPASFSVQRARSVGAGRVAWRLRQWAPAGSFRRSRAPRWQRPVP